MMKHHKVTVLIPDNILGGFIANCLEKGLRVLATVEHDPPWPTVQSTLPLLEVHDSAEPATPEPTPSVTPRRRNRYAGGKKGKGIGCEAFVIRFLEQNDGVRSRKQIKTAMMAHRPILFAANTASPTISNLKKIGRVTVDGDLVRLVR